MTFMKKKKKLSFPNYTRTNTMALLGHSPSVGIMDPSKFFFSLLTWTNKRKSINTTGKSPLKISDVARFESDMT